MPAAGADEEVPAKSGQQGSKSFIDYLSEVEDQT